MDGVIEGMSVRFLVDTGACVTMLKSSIYWMLPDPRRVTLEEEHRRMLLADGSTLPFTGRGKFTIGVGPSTVLHEVLVADIEVDGILGMDFLRTALRTPPREQCLHFDFAQGPSLMPHNTRELSLSARSNL